MRTKKKKEELYALLFRAWMAGALFWFVASGTSIVEMEGNSYFWPLIFTLALSYFIAQVLVLDPIIRAFFFTDNNQIRKTYLEQKLVYRVAKNLGLFFLNLFLILLIALIYWGVNTILGNIGIKGSGDLGFIHPEGIGVGFLYGGLYALYQLIAKKVRLSWSPEGGKHGQRQVS